jgi:sigma-B regulation protein RsbU (phosphoserine phosphatase)
MDLEQREIVIQNCFVGFILLEILDFGRSSIVPNQGKSEEVSMKKGLSIRYKLLVLLSVLPLISLGFYLVIAIQVFEKDKTAYVFDTSSLAAKSLASQVYSDLQSLKYVVRPIIQGYSFEEKDFVRASKDIFKADKSLEYIAIYQQNKNGVFVGAASLKKETLSSRLPKETSEKIGGIVHVAQANEIAIDFLPEPNNEVVFASAIKGPDGATRAIAVALVKEQSFVGALRKPGLYKNYLVNAKGEVLLRAANAETVQFADWEFFSSGSLEQVASATKTTFSPAGEEVILTFHEVGLSNLRIVSYIEKSLAMSATELLVYKSALFFVVIISLGIIVSIFASGSLTSALASLAEATKQVAKGNFEINVKVKAKDEVGQLAGSFNTMAAEVSRLMLESIEKTRMEKELETAKTVQETLFPLANAQIGPMKISGFYEPASECGGDWWHYCEIGENIYFWIGDATGHGAPAALITSAAKSAATVIENLGEVSPAKALQFLNRAIYSTSKGQMMMTFFLAAINKATGKLTYSNASHDPPYLLVDVEGVVKKKDIQLLNEVNSPRLGEKPDTVFKEASLQLQKNSILTMYTDGVFDVENDSGQAWGERRFVKSLTKALSEEAQPQATVDKLVKEMKDFRQDTHLKDDVTLILTRFG